jgi:hypothetical protein
MAFVPSDNKNFPKISGTTLNGKKINLPEHAKGKMCLVAMAYSLKAQSDLAGWVDPVYKSLAGNIMFQTEMYFIPMTGDVKAISQAEIEKKMKEKVDTSLYKYVMIYSGPTKEYIKELNMNDKDKPYFFVINPRGEITYTTSGKYTEAKMEEITDKLSD